MTSGVVEREKVCLRQDMWLGFDRIKLLQIRFEYYLSILEQALIKGLFNCFVFLNKIFRWCSIKIKQIRFFLNFLNQ